MVITEKHIKKFKAANRKKLFELLRISKKENVEVGCLIHYDAAKDELILKTSIAGTRHKVPSLTGEFLIKHSAAGSFHTHTSYPLPTASDIVTNISARAPVFGIGFVPTSKIVFYLFDLDKAEKEKDWLFALAIAEKDLNIVSEIYNEEIENYKCRMIVEGFTPELLKMYNELKAKKKQLDDSAEELEENVMNTLDRITTYKEELK